MQPVSTGLRQERACRNVSQGQSERLQQWVTSHRHTPRGAGGRREGEGCGLGSVPGQGGACRGTFWKVHTCGGGARTWRAAAPSSRKPQGEAGEKRSIESTAITCLQHQGAGSTPVALQLSGYRQRSAGRQVGWSEAQSRPLGWSEPALCPQIHTGHGDMQGACPRD